MQEPRIHLFSVDFNEMLEPDLVLLSADDIRADARGSPVTLTSGLKVVVFEKDTDSSGATDNLVATGIVERNQTTGWAFHVKWCCRSDAAGIRHESEISPPGLTDCQMQ